MTLQFWIGLILFLAGGAMLALGTGQWSTAVGTTFAIAGVGMLGWIWWRRQDRVRDDDDDS